MRLNKNLPSSRSGDAMLDPRDSDAAALDDLSTRNVLPAVSQRRPGGEGLGLFAGIVVVASLGAVTLWSMNSARTQPAAQNAVAPAQVTPPAPLSPTTLPPGPVVPPEAITEIGAPPPAPGQAAVLAAPPQTVPASGNLAAAPTVIFDIGSGQPAPASAAAVQSNAPAPSAPAASPTGNSNEDFASRIGGVGGSAAVARANFNPRTTVTQGTLIPAVLETAIDTDVPGYVRAVVSVDVRSFDGNSVLVPRSSRLIGQYKSGLQAGQKRAYVIWTRLIRPDGVSVNIGSPAVGFAGDAGLPGKVNTHFFERFGSALLLSVVGGLSAIGGNTGVVIAGSGQSAAAAAVGQGGQIGPTVRVRPGQPIRVFTARDLDFSQVSSQ